MCSPKRPKIPPVEPPPPPPRYPDRAAVEAKLRGTSGLGRQSFGGTVGPAGTEGVTSDINLITANVLASSPAGP